MISLQELVEEYSISIITFFASLKSYTKTPKGTIEYMHVCIYFVFKQGSKE